LRAPEKAIGPSSMKRLPLFGKSILQSGLSSMGFQ
jgi:hypothetical protein